MQGVPAIYKGKIINKENFRAYIYGANGNKKLVNSWDEFEANVQTGVWFASKKDAENVKQVEEQKPKQKRAKKIEKQEPVKVEDVSQSDEEEILDLDDGSVFEVTDDFLPNGN